MDGQTKPPLVMSNTCTKLQGPWSNERTEMKNWKIQGEMFLQLMDGQTDEQIEHILGS